MDNRPDDNLLPRFREESSAREAVPDEVLLAALGEALKALEAVPPDFIAAAKDAYAWHGIDAELARLTFDSSQETKDRARIDADSDRRPAAGSRLES